MKRSLIVIGFLFAVPAAALAMRLAPSFPDVQEQQWYGPAVLNAASHGWMSGYPDGRFGPNDGVTRAQMATVLGRYDDGVSPTIAALATIVCMNPKNFLSSLPDGLSEQDKSSYRLALKHLCNSYDFDNSGCHDRFDLETGQRTGGYCE